MMRREKAGGEVVANMVRSQEGVMTCGERTGVKTRMGMQGFWVVV